MRYNKLKKSHEYVKSNDNNDNELIRTVMNAPKEILKSELLNILNNDPRKARNFVMKHCKNEIKNIKKSVKDGFMDLALEQDYHSDVYDFYDFSVYCHNLLSNIENKLSPGELVLKIYEIEDQIIDLMIEYFGDSIHVYENYTFDFFEYTDNLIYNFITEKNDDKIEDIANYFHDMFRSQTGFEEDEVYLSPLYDLSNFGYHYFAKKVLDDLINEIREYAARHDIVKGQYILNSPIVYDKYYELSLNQNIIKEQIDRFLFRVFADNDFDLQDEIIDRNLLFNRKDYQELRILLDVDLTDKWDQLQLKRYEIKYLKETKNISKLKIIYLTEINNSVTYDRYIEYKEIATKEETSILLDSIVEKYSTMSHVKEEILDILFFEKRFNNMVSLISRDVAMITKYYLKIPNTFNDVKNEIYEHYLIESVEKLYKRSQYKTHCKDIVKYSEIANQNVGKLLIKIKKRYSRRSAMLEELDKIRNKLAIEIFSEKIETQEIDQKPNVVAQKSLFDE
jgi:hypothetical protein